MFTLKHIFIAILLILCSELGAQGQGNADEKIRTQLKNLRMSYITAIKTHKPEIFGTFYKEDIRLMPECQKTIIGKKQAISYHKAFFNRFQIQNYTRSEIEILDMGPCISELGQFTMQINVIQTGKEYTLNGKYQQIWEKSQSENGVVLVTDGWNYNHSLEIETLMRFAEVPFVDIAFQPHVPVNTPVRFELAALNLLMEAAVSQHDERIWSQFYTDSAMLLSRAKPLLSGRNEIDTYIKTHVSELPVFEKLDIRADRVDDMGEYVIEYASHIANWRGGEYSGVNTGKDLRIWRRESNGSLKIFRHIGMYD